MSDLDFRSIWAHALTFEQFLVQSKEEHRLLWDGIYRHLRLPDWAAETAAGKSRKLLVITEDWCMDASSTIPALVRLAEGVKGVELRIILRDQNLGVMQHYMTGTAKAIPIVIVLDEEFQELGHWGPRPAELQAWFQVNRGVLSTEELVRERRRWYARDRGETTLREVLALF